MQKGPLKALLAVLAVAGFQNRDKITEMLREATGRGAGNPPEDGTQPAGTQAGTGSAAGGGLGDLLGGGSGRAQGGGGLGDLLGGLGGLGGAQGGTQGGLGGLGGILAGGSLGAILNNGLGELLEQFQQTGHGDKADSWVKPGENQPIDDRELSDALGADVLADLAARTGLSEQEILSRLSKDLPGVVDELTPEGQVPPARTV